jgi:hypothetical protein
VTGKTTLLKLTVALHVVLATFVALDSRKQGRSTGRWVAATLLTGVIGFAVYLLSADGEDLPLDELVDRVDVE